MLKDKTKAKKERKVRLRKRIRERVRGTAERPRVHIFKSNLYVYAQAVDDTRGSVLTAASTLEKAFKEKSENTKNKKACEVLGRILGARLKEKKIGKIVFDRGIYLYHGRLKSMADAMRKDGIEF